MTELYTFKAKPGVWLTHPNRDETGVCVGRIVRLYYPWKGDTIYCDRECCKITDPEAIMMSGYYGPEAPKFIRHIVASPTHYDPVPFRSSSGKDGLFWCMDCGRLGVVEEVPA